MYKTERVLSLVGAIIGAVAFFWMLIVGLIMGVLGAAAMMYGGGGAGLLVGAIIAVILSLVSFILGFVGSSKLKKEDKKGGVIAIVAGGLALIACIVGFIAAAGWFMIPSVVLYLIAGIMVMTKKAPAAPAE